MGKVHSLVSVKIFCCNERTQVTTSFSKELNFGINDTIEEETIEICRTFRGKFLI
jgi:hypothetical protein